MATKSAILSVKIVSDAADFSKKMDGASKKIDSFSDTAKKMAVPAAAVVAGIGAIAIASGKLASESQQNFGAVDAVFKGQAKSVNDMAKKSADALGISGSDYMKYSALLGSQLKNAGTPIDQLVGKTSGLIAKGADLAAQFGGTVPDAVEALSSALKGEMDPIEKYGITLNQTLVDNEAAALGFKKIGKVYSASAKQAALLSLVQKQSGDATGAFGREADTAAGQQARATAAWEDAAAALGTVLLPAMTELAKIAAEVAKWVMENQGLVTHLVVIFGILAGVVLVLAAAMAVMNAVALLNPFVLLVVAVAALIAIIIYVATQTTVFSELWAGAASGMADAWNGLMGFLADAWNGYWSFMLGALNAFGAFFASIFQFIFKVSSDVVNGIVNGFRGAFEFIYRISSDVIGGIVGFFNNIIGAVQNAISWVRNLFSMSGVPGWLKDVLGMGGTGFEFTGAFAPAGSELGIGATGGFSAPSMPSRNAPAAAVYNDNRVITVNGALDADAVGRQLQRILQQQDRNRGYTSAAGGF